MVFNSLGSNYTFSFAMKALFGGGNKADQIKLEKYLADRYSGKVTLLYKGREAIALALKVLNFSKGSCVAINGYTCYAVYQPIAEAGLKTEYLDIAENSLHFSARELSAAVENNPSIKAVIIQNTLGYACDIEGISEVCRQRNVFLIEDLAHSVGAVYKNGREAGSFGDFVILSFSQDKIIDAVSGGALIVRNKKYMDVPLPVLSSVNLKHRLKDRFYPNFTYKIRKEYAIGLGKLQHKFLKALGWLSQPMGTSEKIVLRKLPAWQCRLALGCFMDLDKNIAHRKSIAQTYQNNLGPNIAKVYSADKIVLSTNLRFPILVKNREGLISYLKNYGIHISDIWYDAPVAPAKYTDKSSYNHDCPKAENVSREMLNLPTHINVSQKQAEGICYLINTWFR